MALALKGVSLEGKGRRLAAADVGLCVGAAILAALVLAAALADWIAPYDPLRQSLMRRNLPPFWLANNNPDHLLGTDRIGRDILSRLLHGARVSLVVGFGAAAISAVIGTVLGMAGGYFGGRVDAVVSYLLTTRLCMPVMLVAMAIATVSGGSMLTMLLLLGLMLWHQYAVVARATTQQLTRLEYVLAARAAGASHWRILARELLPNVLPMLLVIGTLEVSHAILIEAALSFLGVGIKPPTPSWGGMIADGKSFIMFSAWQILIPGASLFLVVLAINLIGDGLHQRLRPGGR